MRYWADRQIFLKDAKLSLETLHQRARQTAFLVPGLTIVVRDEHGLGEGGSKGEETFRFDGGISEFCEYLAQRQARLRRAPAAPGRAPSRRPSRSWTTAAT